MSLSVFLRLNIYFSAVWEIHKNTMQVLDTLVSKVRTTSEQVGYIENFDFF